MPDLRHAQKIMRDRGVYSPSRGVDPARMEAALREIIGCFEKAAAEGLGDRLVELPHHYKSAWDIINRRIEPVYLIAKDGLK